MPCYNPMQAKFVLAEDGSRKIKFSGANAKAFFEGRQVESDCFHLPCGVCMGCRLEHSRQWAMRCMHEASLYKRNVFVTLTYRPEDLPEGGTLVKRDLQLFMKKLRRKMVPVMPEGLSEDDQVRWQLKHCIRFYACGEYGDQFTRPHYHVILFNCDFDDKRLWRKTSEGLLFTSEVLSSVWEKGFCSIGDVTSKSCGYVARYCTKIVKGSGAEVHYDGRQPEFSLMSRKPGIGYGWYLKFKSDCYPSDYLITRGVKVKVPKYYDAKLKESDPDLLERLKSQRKLQASTHADDNTYRRLKDREFCKEVQVKRLFRPMEGIHVT